VNLQRRLDIVGRLRGEFNQPLVVNEWWRDALRALDNPTIHEVALSLVRQSGKSQFLAAAAISELFVKPNAFVLYVAASEGQATSIFGRKLKSPLLAVRQSLGIGKQELFISDRSIEIPSTGAALEVIPTSKVSAPGRSPTLLILDEARYIPDDVFSVLAPSVIGAGGTVVIASSAGPPRGFFHALVTHPTEHTFLYRSATNENPYANRGVLNFIRQRLALLAPSAAQRELGNEFTEDGDTFLPSALIDVAVDDSLGELSSSAHEAFCFIDLSRKRDLTSVVVVIRTEPRQPEARDHLVIASLRTWDPKAEPTKEVPFAEVRAHVLALPARFPRLIKILVDEGAEAGSLLPFCRSEPTLTLKTDGFVASATTNEQIWSALAARLHAKTLSIPRHERLLGELRNLRQETFALGSRWRIVDASRQFHRDIAVSLAGACYTAGQAEILGPLPPWLLADNLAAPPVLAAFSAAVYGAGTAIGFGGFVGGTSLNESAYGGRAFPDPVRDAPGTKPSGFR